MRIDILGTSFNVRTDEDPEYLREVVEHYRAKVREMERAGTTNDPLKLAILAGLVTADEFLKLNGSLRVKASEASRAAESMIAELDGALDEPDA
ncbi:MAG: cell division protein ZapA [Spirochaetaceae bacterium]|nr:MAG: cell division protein ZapA [Spirochaetaceae bacterium]